MCNRCGRLLPVSSFGKKSRSCDGLKHTCKDCDRELIRNYKRKQASGATPGQVQELLERQGGVCAICGLPETTSNRGKRVSEWAVDHDHVTGVARGLLCNRCNFGLGCFDDDVTLLQKALAYLEFDAERMT